MTGLIWFAAMLVSLVIVLGFVVEVATLAWRPLLAGLFLGLMVFGGLHYIPRMGWVLLQHGGAPAMIVAALALALPGFYLIWRDILPRKR